MNDVVAAKVSAAATAAAGSLLDMRVSPKLRGGGTETPPPCTRYRTRPTKLGAALSLALIVVRLGRGSEGERAGLALAAAHPYKPGPSHTRDLGSCARPRARQRSHRCPKGRWPQGHVSRGGRTGKGDQVVM